MNSSAYIKRKRLALNNIRSHINLDKCILEIHCKKCGGKCGEKCGNQCEKKSGGKCGEKCSNQCEKKCEKKCEGKCGEKCGNQCEKKCYKLVETCCNTNFHDYDDKFYNDVPERDDICCDKTCYCYQSKILNLNVTTVNKVNHPWANRIKNDVCYAIDEIKGKTIFLIRGYTYNFNITDPRNSFYFTTDPLGGSRINPIIIPQNATVGNTISLYVSQLLPSAFFYQSTNDTAMGGIVIIQDPEYCEPKNNPECDLSDDISLGILQPHNVV